ncbi:unnamed protein product [Tuber melanosporum]|uniref:(Perigord truffle) hypothetical protein n=1 Tax=Tuber melanosporum (strain Mel28) TaxID=656061 RepID=D5GHE2_TUBMM|nr:uncharacterized protein GSTUM_00007825001 [Tuber melanosporum]CAZ83935.1 unnamed protein product [Tuber melanosporum]
MDRALFTAVSLGFSSGLPSYPPRYILGDPLYPEKSRMKTPPSRTDSKFTDSTEYRYLPSRPTVKPDDSLSGG